MERDLIKETLNYIEEQVGLKLTLCGYFTGLRETPAGKYFNVVFNTPVWRAKEYHTLLRLSEKQNKIYVEPGGYARLSIFLQDDRTKS